MPIVTLRDLYVAELRDLFDAERQILHELPVIASSATSSALRDAFLRHLERTRVHAERLELLLRKLDAADDGGRPCEAMRVLIAEARHRVAEGERGEVLDAALIGVAQRMEHYEIAAYGCARSYARTLHDSDAARMLQQTLDEERDADVTLTRIAEQVNQAAGEDLRPDIDRQRERLRYVPVGRLHDFKYRAYHVRGAEDEDLGRLDGLIVEARTHRPDYFVIDSGGWFVGGRYVVPLNELQPDNASRTLRTNLSRTTIAAYPPFNPNAYLEGDAAEPGVGTVEEFRPPTWLMTGVWMTEASGFASVPPRAQADFGAGVPPTPDNPEESRAAEAGESSPPRERMTARGGDDGPPKSDTDNSEPRIERYRER